MISVIADDIKHEEVTFEKKEPSCVYQHPKNLNDIIADGKKIGEIGLVNSLVMKKIDKKGTVAFAEIDVEEFSKIKNKSISYKEPSRFPEIEIDLSFICDTFKPIKDEIKGVNCPLIKNISVLDVYEDENGKSITVRILFSHSDRTLTKEEVAEVVDKIVANLKAKNIEMKM